MRMGRPLLNLCRKKSNMDRDDNALTPLEPISRGRPTPVDVDAKKRRLAAAVRWSLAIAAAAVIAPVVFLAVKGMVGLALALVIGLAIVNAAPVVAMKFANWKLRGLKDEAARNPIETLQNQQVEREKALKNFASQIESFDAELETYRAELVSEAREHPEAARAGLPTLRQMERLLMFRRAKYKRAAKDLEERRKLVESAQSKYRVALAAQRVSKAAGATDPNVLDKILEDVAFDSVERAVSGSMAALRTAVMVEEIPLDDNDLLRIDQKAPVVDDVASGMDYKALLKELEPIDPITQRSLS